MSATSHAMVHCLHYTGRKGEGPWITLHEDLAEARRHAKELVGKIIGTISGPEADEVRRLLAAEELDEAMRALERVPTSHVRGLALETTPVRGVEQVETGRRPGHPSRALHVVWSPRDGHATPDVAVYASWDAAEAALEAAVLAQPEGPSVAASVDVALASAEEAALRSVPQADRKQVRAGIAAGRMSRLLQHLRKHRGGDWGDIPGVQSLGVIRQVTRENKSVRGR